MAAWPTLAEPIRRAVLALNASSAGQSVDAARAPARNRRRK
jgi:hypothetical protein